MNGEFDFAVIAELAGKLDLTKPVTLRHYLYFKSLEPAQILQAMLMERKVSCLLDRLDDEWSLKADITEVVSVERLAAWRKALTDLAVEFQGEYDGWECAITR